MGRLTVSVEQDHLERLIKSPVHGLGELIWNSLDADATTVDVKVVMQPLGGPESVTVTDDGTGMSLEHVETYFSHLGGSWKKNATTTDRGRRLHGRAGQGRWAAYGLGEVIQWSTVSDRVTGERQRLEIIGRRSALRDFDVSDPVPAVGDEAGTIVRVSQLTAAQKAFLSDTVADELTTILALYLQQYPVTVRYSGTALDPANLQIKKHRVELAVDGIEGIDLVIIEWKKQIKRALHLCDATGTSLAELAPGVHAAGFDFTAYIRWDGFREMVSELPLADLGHEPLTTIVEAARDELRQYFKDRTRERGAELVQSWKADTTYPYKGEPATTVERAERDLFDVVAVAAASAVEDAEISTRRFSLRLLREAVETSPSAVHGLLQEVLDLPPERLEELRDLVERTSLSAIIAAARQITDRLDFLMGLEEIVFDRELKKHVLERRQLHRILASETWVFREEYWLTADDVTLRTALRDHIKLLGRDQLTPDDVDSSDVRDENDRRVVVDMMLSRVVEQRRNQREHIVIELKRPTVHIGVKEIGQIQNYATTIAEDSRFAAVNAQWEFWIVGDEFDQSASRMANQKDREPGVIVVGDNYIVRGVPWAKIIQDARHRLTFVRNALDYSSSTDAGMTYLRQTHGKYLPSIAHTSDRDGEITSASS
jgi:Histidine kinase-, DNA gyrase B-, and HSP90-like ATPase